MHKVSKKAIQYMQIHSKLYSRHSLSPGDLHADDVSLAEFYASQTWTNGFSLQYSLRVLPCSNIQNT